MAQAPNIDGILITWGDRLFYPGNRVVKVKPQPKMGGDAARLRAAAIRKRIEATVVRRAPQVMVKVTGGGRGMGAIKAHMAYISKRGKLEIEDQEGERHNGREAIGGLAWEWRYAGTRIPEVSHRREAFNIIFSMPRGTEAAVVRAAAREVMRDEFRGHRYAMVLHEHQENPHAHVVVRAERDDGRRLNPRKADLHRWRERFAGALRGYGIEAAATRQAVRGEMRRPDLLWERAARSEGRLRRERAPLNEKSLMKERDEALENWSGLGRAFASSQDPEDRALAGEVARFLPSAPIFARRLAAQHSRLRSTQDSRQSERAKSHRSEDRPQETGGPER